MRKLIQGLHHFQSQIFQSQRELFERLTHGQSPDALFITCSDSRINPNLMTQTDPGDIFILRNAGNIIPPYGGGVGGEAATIEYAVVKLGIKDIIVCGHSMCGAMEDLISEEHKSDTPACKEWLKYSEVTKRIINENYRPLNMTKEDLVLIAVQENVLLQLEHLRTHPCVAAKLSSGDLHLHGWTYKILTGEVFSYEPNEGQFIPLAEAHGVSEKDAPRLLKGPSI